MSRTWSHHEDRRRGSARLGAIVVMQVVLAIAAAVCSLMIAACAARPFPHQLPDANGFSTDVTWQQAFRAHHLRVPSNIRGLRYSAYSDVDGYPLWSIFRAACDAFPAFIARNHLTQVSSEAALPDGSVYSFARQMGWRPSSAGARWYQRPPGPSANLEVLVAGRAAVCAVYLVGGG